MWTFFRAFSLSLRSFLCHLFRDLMVSSSDPLLSDGEDPPLSPPLPFLPPPPPPPPPLPLPLPLHFPLLDPSLLSPSEEASAAASAAVAASSAALASVAAASVAAAV